jgi:hypothetical protein
VHLFDRILQSDELIKRPPVLLDIGASGAIHPKWKKLAKYSICIAFDADEREFSIAENRSHGFRELYVFNRLVSTQASEEASFYLTSSPFCSSLLKPDEERLSKWFFSPLFHVERVTSLKTVTIPDILNELRLQKIDWFKSDSQGTDLRLFQSLGDDRIRRTLVAEFEPGIIDAYSGEDKLWMVIAFMEKQPFWLAAMKVRGALRLSRAAADLRLHRLDRALAHALVTRSPGWGELTYLNDYSAHVTQYDKRDYLLGWIFSQIEKQYGFTLELATKGHELYNDPIFREMADYSISGIRRGYWRIPFKAIRSLYRRLF